MQAKWWENPNYIHLLLQTAKEIDAKYPDKNLIALGHSPSWLVVTAALIRASENRPRNVSYLAFSGNCHQINTQNAFKNDRHPTENPDDVVKFERSKYYVQDEEALQQLHSELKKRKIDPLSLTTQRAKTGVNGAVLIDFGRSAAGVASFIDSYAQIARTQGIRGHEQVFDVHIFKQNYTDQVEPVDIESAQIDGLHLTPLFQTQSGGAGDLLNIMAGYKGEANSSDKYIVDQETNAGRFMPYASIFQLRPDSNYTPKIISKRKAQADAKTIGAIKSTIKAAMQFPECDSKEMARAATEELHKSSPIITKNSWYAMPRGYH